MASLDEIAPRHSRLVVRRPRWRLVVAFMLVLLATLAVLAVATDRAASEMLRQQALQHLRDLRGNAAREIEAHFSRLESHIVSLAHDPNTLSALRQLDDATAELESDPLTEPAKMRHQMESLKDFVEHYYQSELSDKTLDLHALLLPERSAVWLQAAYLAAGSEELDATGYAHSHAAWNPLFGALRDRFEFEDLYLIDAVSGRVVYSVRKRPDFQTNLLDGPYAASTLGALFRQLQKAADDGHYHIIDFAPYVPEHGMPAAFAGAPIFDHGRCVGALVVQLSSEPITRILSANGQWSQTGLGATGELYLIGRGESDSLMRSQPRFASAPESTTPVLHQRVAAMPDNANAFEGQYLNYRGVPVLGSVGRVSRLVGLNWNLIAEMSSAETLQPLSQLRRRLGWLALLLFVGALALTTGLATALATPPAGATSPLDSDGGKDDYQRRLEADLRPIVTAVVAASEGDLSQRLTLNGSALGRLPHALNRMWRSAGALISHVHSSATAAINSAQEVQTAVGQLSREAVQCTAELTTTSALIRETQSRLNALAAEAAMAGDAAQLTEAVARKCDEAVARMAAGMDTIHQHARTLTIRMKRVGERSMEISTVIGTMQDIIAQANLLALNATIEASRAGEHGLGFKTVANDVRKLATQMDTAAKDMAELATSLHSEAADAVDCIDTQAEEIDRQTAFIGDAALLLSRRRDTRTQNVGPPATMSVTTREHVRATGMPSAALQGVAEFVRRTHVLAEQAVHSSGVLLSVLSELNSWARTFRLRTGGDVSAQGATHAEVIELEPQQAVRSGREAGA